MDANLIYEKTAAGEEAMRQRTRLVQRHMRMVLILVDGRTSVSELSTKVGNPSLVESALADLERDGFIAPLLEQPSVWDKGTAVVQKVKDVAISQFSTFGSAQADAGGNDFGQPQDQAPEPIPLPGDPTPEPARVEKKAPPTVAWLAGWKNGDGGGKETTTNAPAARKVPAGEDTGIRPIRRPGSRSMGKGGKLALGVALALGLGVAVVGLYPYDSHRPEAEAVLTRLLGQPVTASHLGVTFLPKPGLVLEGVRIGNGDSGTVARLQFVPELGNPSHLKEVEIVGARLPLSSVAVLPDWLRSTGGAHLQVSRVHFQDLALQSGPLVLEGLSGTLGLGEGNTLQQLALQNGDHSLSIEVRPAQGGVQLALDGQGWEPVKGGGLRFDALNAQGLLTTERLDFSKVEGRLMEGQFSASLALAWGNGIKLDGDSLFKHLSARRLSQAVGQLTGQGWKLEGEVDGRLRLTARAPDWSRLGSQLQGDGSFGVGRGILFADLAEAVRRASSEPLHGGETRFDQLSVNLRFDGQGTRLSDLRIAAGLLKAAGNLAVTPKGELSGGLDVQIGGRGNLLQMPVTVSGSVADPVLRGARR